MKIPNEKQVEDLLRSRLKEVSPSFEAALGRIPVRNRLQPVAFLKPFAIAAALILGLGLFVLQESRTFSPAGPPTVGTGELDPEWIDLLTLAESVAPAGELTDPELRLALEYYAFNR
ncbi:MAG TPA: hypothetical protein VJ960_02770 [Oceanipulchritudo sp.]|nr:hypothetical protein [Oceanipulchritudo sp.]